ncbi:MAG: tRNA pseudouridine(55) synthase TruB [Spirochaetaceae bacterium]|jgi:tRNA pseudouridine55 synthase|nr:tRNA pseudouridine(55) synthase TruB [Spirochaetaceae bacterium]
MKTSAGLLLINKQPGITSFGTLNAIKKAFYPAKIGHTGTLDKFAGGLLLVLVGRAVKLAPWFSGADKEYEGTIRFGLETDTLDPEGSPVASADLPSRERLEEALPRFRGHILQRPPAYSAVHIGGERAYKLAREGSLRDMPERPVVIHALELRSWEPPFASIRVRCSKGTYIRSLARDIALAAGSRGHLAALTRTGIAGFSLKEALYPGEAGLPEGLRPPGPEVFETLGIPCLLVDRESARRIGQGKALEPLIDEGKLTLGGLPFVDQSLTPPGGEPLSAAVFYPSPEGVELGAMIVKKAGKWTYGYVYAAACSGGPVADPLSGGGAGGPRGNC